MTIAIAVVPAYCTNLAAAWYTVNVQKKTINKYGGIKITDMLVFAVFVTFFTIGVQASHSVMHEACGFSPDHEGAKHDIEKINLQHKIDNAQHELDLLNK